jgi:hypothetical protein
VFGHCAKLDTIIVESGNEIFDSRNDCNAVIETKTGGLIAGCMNTIIPYSIISIEDYAFKRCGNLKSVDIPNSMRSIGIGAFYGCHDITHIVVSDSVTKIGEWSFYYCEGLTEITIGRGVKTIGKEAFDGCNSLKNIKCRIIYPDLVSLGANVFYYLDTYNCVLHVPKGTKNLYSKLNQWRDFRIIIDDLEVPMELGDVNSDEKVNVSDVTSLVNMILGTTTMNQASADVNSDGRVNVSDITALINLILGIH